MLGRQLVGEDFTQASLETGFDIEERDSLRATEMAALASVYPAVAVVDTTSPSLQDGLNIGPVAHLSIPIPNTPLTLHVILPDRHPYPLSTRSPPMYISTSNASTTHSVASNAPPYIRLHILSTVLRSPMVKDRDHGEGVGLVAAGIIEEEWNRIQRHGPPDVADVLQHFLIGTQERSNTASTPDPNSLVLPVVESNTRRSRNWLGGSRIGDDRNDAQILMDFEQTKRSEQYQSLLNERKNLPAWKAKSNFLHAFNNNRVVVCVGETGSGKTTQIPQYILEDYLAAAEHSSPIGARTSSLGQIQIIVTQPRRVAAISVATRVSAERGDDASVGYTIRGESNATRRTKLLFCTTGVILRRLGSSNGLDDVAVVVVDEVRTQ